MAASRRTCAGNHTVQRIADLLQVPRSTIYGHLYKSSIVRRPTAGWGPAKTASILAARTLVIT